MYMYTGYILRNRHKDKEHTDESATYLCMLYPEGIAYEHICCCVRRFFRVLNKILSAHSVCCILLLRTVRSIGVYEQRFRPVHTRMHSAFDRRPLHTAELLANVVLCSRGLEASIAWRRSRKTHISWFSSCLGCTLEIAYNSSWGGSANAPLEPLEQRGDLDMWR